MNGFNGDVLVKGASVVPMENKICTVLDTGLCERVLGFKLLLLVVWIFTYLFIMLTAIVKASIHLVGVVHLVDLHYLVLPSIL